MLRIFLSSDAILQHKWYCNIKLMLSRQVHLFLYEQHEGARGVMVIVVGNGHGDTSSNPGRD